MVTRSRSAPKATKPRVQAKTARRPARTTKRRWPLVRPWPLILVATAILAALVPLPAWLVERVFSRGFYAALQPAVTFASNLAPFAWLDLAIGAVVALLIGLGAVNFMRSGGLFALRRTLERIVVWGAAIYLAFLVLWGLNYRRERMPERLAFDAAAVTPAAAARLASVAVDRLNALHAAAHAEGWVSGGAIDPALAGAFDRIARAIGGLSRGIVVGRPKRSILDWYFRRAGVSGMTDPIFLETLVASDLLPYERPHVIAHEWAHLAGLADEGEANVAGWLACLAGSTADQYSGWLFMYGEAVASLAGHERVAVAGRVADGPRADLAAIRDRSLRNVDRRLSAAGWQVYDAYLRANRIESGTRSYSDVVRLALGLDAARPFR
jgi:uncharacterized protein DUF3810